MIKNYSQIGRKMAEASAYAERLKILVEFHEDIRKRIESLPVDSIQRKGFEVNLLEVENEIKKLGGS